MPSTYTVNLGLEQPATGEQAGVWGTTANNSYKFLDDGIDGNVVVPLSASSYTLLTSQGVDSVGRNKVIIFTGTLTGDGFILIAPNTAKKIYYVINKTTGGFALNFSASGSTGQPYKLLAGRSAVIYCDGQGGTAAVSGVLADLQVNSLQVVTDLIIGGQVQWGAPAVFNQLSTFQAGVVIQAPMTINLGGDAVNDMYYRSSAGPVARLPIGPAGTVLTAGSGGLSWTAPSTPAIGMAIGGATGNPVLFVNVGVLSQDTGFQWKPGIGLGIGLTPVRALSIGGGVPAAIQMDAVVDGVHAPAQRGWFYSSNGAPRWVMETSAELEAGGGTGTSVSGCNVSLKSFNNNFTTQSLAWACYRTGRMTVGVYADSWDSQFTVENSIGAGNIQAWVNSGGAIVASVDALGGGHFSNVLGGVNIQINGGAPFTGPFTYLNFVAQAGMIITAGGVGGPGGNTFTINLASTTSDIQLKRNVQPLAGGLALISRLRPISAEWNGLAGTREGQRMVSVIAQDLAVVIPEAVSPYRARLRPEDERDVELLGLEPMAITSHLILAVQQLDARLKALEP